MDVPARVNVLLLTVGGPAVSEHWTTVPSNVSDTVTVSSDVKSAKGGLGTALTITALNSPLPSMSPTLASGGNTMESLLAWGMNGSAIHWSPPTKVNTQVKVTTSLGQAACLPSCSTLEVRDTVDWADARPGKLQEKSYNAGFGNESCDATFLP